MASLAGDKKDDDKKKMTYKELEELEKQVLQNIKTKFTHFNNHFKGLSDEQRLLLTQKGVYPYDFMDSFDQFKVNKFPTREQCYNKLNNEELSLDDHERALNVWE